MLHADRTIENLGLSNDKNKKELDTASSELVVLRKEHASLKIEREKLLERKEVLTREHKEVAQHVHDYYTTIG
jgi:chromosome segregation ATPase